MQDEERPGEDERLGEVALVRQSEVPSPGSREKVVAGVGDEVGKRGEHAEGQDGEGVQKRVEADDDPEQNDLWM